MKGTGKHPTGAAVTASELSVTERNSFIVRVYRIFIYSLLFSAICSFIGVLLDFPFSWWWIGAELAVLLICLIFKTSTSLLYLWSGMSGLTMAPLLSNVIDKGNGHVIWIAIFATAILFVGLSMYVHYTRKSFSHWKGILFIALILLVFGASLLLMFPRLINEVVWSSMGIIIFSAYVLFDTSRIIEEYGPGEEASAAMDLHLDFINLFLDILRILIRLSGKAADDTGEDATIDQDGDATDLAD